MLARTHLTFALFTALVIAQFVNVNPWLFYPLVLFGALLPDLDHDGSTINKILPLTKWFSYLFKHRGIFHSIWPIVTIVIVASALGAWEIGVYLSIGYFSHLVSDSFTKLGVRFLYPFRSLYARGPIKVGGLQEKIFSLVLLVGCVIVFFL